MNANEDRASVEAQRMTDYRQDGGHVARGCSRLGIRVHWRPFAVQAKRGSLMRGFGTSEVPLSAAVHRGMMAQRICKSPKLGMTALHVLTSDWRASEAWTTRNAGSTPCFFPMSPQERCRFSLKTARLATARRLTPSFNPMDCDLYG